MPVVIYSIVPLAYASGLTYHTWFQCKIPAEFMGISCRCMGFYSMQWRATDASSLLFNAYYLCRLQFPLCWLYLMVLDWDLRKNHDVRVTAFQHVVQMNTNSFLGENGLNLVAALLVSFYAVFSYLRSHDFTEDRDAEAKICVGATLLMRPESRQGRDLQSTSQL